MGDMICAKVRFAHFITAKLETNFIFYNYLLKQTGFFLFYFFVIFHYSAIEIVILFLRISMKNKVNCNE